MNIHQSAEDYLEAILMIQEEKGAVRSIDIANSLDFTRASVSFAIKNLKESGYIFVDDKGLIELSDSGLAIAKNILFRHKLLTTFFSMLGVKSTVAAEDACKVEHVISSETFEAIKLFTEETKR